MAGKGLEALLNDVDTLQGMYMETRASKDKKAWFHKFADDLRNDIKQALQAPSSEDIIDTLTTHIVRFEDGTYFNGVKGKMVRKTQNFKDAKRIDNGILCTRDKGYIERFHNNKSYNYKIIKVKYVLESESESNE